jgi:hypothetical protein
MFSLKRIKQTGSLPVRDRSRRVGYWSCENMATAPKLRYRRVAERKAWA